MATRIVHRIAPPHIIADAVSALLGQVEQSPSSAEMRERSINAIAKAFGMLIEGVRFEHAEGEYVFPSRTRSGIAHRVNGKCDCEAASEQHQPCWHRAAVRVIKLVEEAERASLITPPPAEQPGFHCPRCASPMQWSVTPGGEECVECLNPKCVFTIHADVVEAFFA